MGPWGIPCTVLLLQIFRNFHLKKRQSGFKLKQENSQLDLREIDLDARRMGAVTGETRGLSPAGNDPNTEALWGPSAFNTLHGQV